MCWENSLLTRDGIESACVKGMATAETLHSVPDAADGTVDFDGLAHVFRAGGMEAAGGGQERRDHALVPPDDS
jgi:hypothetical protein